MSKNTTYCLGLIVDFLNENKIEYKYESEYELLNYIESSYCIDYDITNDKIKYTPKDIEDGVSIHIKDKIYMSIQTHVTFAYRMFASVAIVNHSNKLDKFEIYDNIGYSKGTKFYKTPEELFESLKIILNK